jgi:LmbE family N-acetylglucosaminyl deacetylase
MREFSLNRDATRTYRVLCLGAHSDDIEIGCGGTILKLLASSQNVVLQWVVFSATQQRRQEASASANRFLVNLEKKTVVLHNFKDSFFPLSSAEIKESFERLKYDFSPDLILSHYRNDLHQDHRLISDLTWNTFRNHLILEYEIPKYDGDFGSPNVFVPLDKPTYQQKIRFILESFPSQREKQWFSRDLFLAILRLRGMEANAPSGYAEAFYCRKALLDLGPSTKAEPKRTRQKRHKAGEERA